jgi:hypothetical protein
MPAARAHASLPTPKTKIRFRKTPATPVGKRRRMAQAQHTPAATAKVARSTPRATAARPQGRLLEAVSTARFALLVGAVVGGFILYVGHVHATQQVLNEVQQLRRENMTLHLRYNRVKGEFDRATGPGVIYQRAEALGLKPGIPYRPLVTRP